MDPYQVHDSRHAREIFTSQNQRKGRECIEIFRRPKNNLKGIEDNWLA